MRIKDEILEKIGDEFVASPALRKRYTFWEYLLQRISTIRTEPTIN
jgi:hypothetical protein